MRLYHVSERRNLRTILAQGLMPRYDRTVRSKQLSRGTVINLGGKKAIEEVLWEEPWDDPVLLEVEVPRKDLVRLEHISSNLYWYASRKPISSSRIKVIGNPTKLLGV